MAGKKDDFFETKADTYGSFIGMTVKSTVAILVVTFIVLGILAP